jgi:hypothetical protein
VLTTKKMSNTTTTTCPPPLFPSTDLNTCNIELGGICLSQTTCMCQSGWTGYGDFQKGAPTCAINIIAIRALYGLMLTIQTLLLFFSLFCIYKKFFSQEAWIKQTHHGNSNKAHIHGTRAANAIVILAPLYNISFIITASLRLSDQDQNMMSTRTIGTDPAITFFFSLGSGLFWTCVPLFVYYFLHVSLRNATTKDAAIRDKSELMFRRLQIFLPLSWIVTTISSAAPLIGLTTSDDRNLMFAMASIHYVGIGFSLIFLPLYLLPKFINPLKHDLQALINSRPSFDTSQMKAVVIKLNNYSREATNQAVLNVVLCIVLGIFPYCSNWSSYWLPIAWTGAAPLSGTVLYLIAIPAKRGKTSSGGVMISGNNSSSTGNNNNNAHNNNTTTNDSSSVTHNKSRHHHGGGGGGGASGGGGGGNHKIATDDGSSDNKNGSMVGGSIVVSMDA